MLDPHGARPVPQISWDSHSCDNRHDCMKWLRMPRRMSSLASRREYSRLAVTHWPNRQMDPSCWNQQSVSAIRQETPKYEDTAEEYPSNKMVNVRRRRVNVVCLIVRGAAGTRRCRAARRSRPSIASIQNQIWSSMKKIDKAARRSNRQRRKILTMSMAVGRSRPCARDVIRSPLPRTYIVKTSECTRRTCLAMRLAGQWVKRRHRPRRPTANRRCSWSGDNRPVTATALRRRRRHLEAGRKHKRTRWPSARARGHRRRDGRRRRADWRATKTTTSRSASRRAGTAATATGRTLNPASFWRAVSRRKSSPTTPPSPRQPAAAATTRLTTRSLATPTSSSRANRWKLGVASRTAAAAAATTCHLARTGGTGAMWRRNARWTCRPSARCTPTFPREPPAPHRNWRRCRQRNANLQRVVTVWDATAASSKCRSSRPVWKRRAASTATTTRATSSLRTSTRRSGSAATTERVRPSRWGTTPTTRRWRRPAAGRRTATSRRTWRGRRCATRRARSESRCALIRRSTTRGRPPTGRTWYSDARCRCRRRRRCLLTGPGYTRAALCGHSRGPVYAPSTPASDSHAAASRWTPASVALDSPPSPPLAHTPQPLVRHSSIRSIFVWIEIIFYLVELWQKNFFYFWMADIAHVIMLYFSFFNGVGFACNLHN